MMFLHVIMICCFSAVCLEASEVLEVSGHVGGDVSIRCSGRRSTYNSSEHSTMYFCKDVCSGENILIQTKRRRSAVTQQSRYDLEVDRRDGVFTVTIKKLQRVDAGRYHCGVETAANLLYQEVNLIVLDAPTVPPGSSPSATTALEARSETLTWGNFISSTDQSAAALTPPPSEKKRNLGQASKLTDTTLVIIVSGSLALLVCAIIPVIFYGHWRSNSEGQNRPRGNKSEGDYYEENAVVGVKLQTFEPEVDPESSAHDASQYASAYAALDPKTLD
ncbi:CMRF35-like molecule 3 [Stegastes partitus]|uniref:CMRF35-like molecule 3 n=1 Tax=Stegastes partitus TaxID=144197 RepID=A0A9Y4KCJ7_9TELE|nr:PREDICTED: CMRF35-like molecule 3 [Stegastes partitus]